MSVICLKTYRDARVIAEILGPLTEEFRQQMAKVSPEAIDELKTILKPSTPRKRTERECVGSMAWYPKLKHWKGCNGKAVFDPATERAYSYGWWRFVERINGMLVFNAYRYSNTTTGHLWAVRNVLEHLGIGINLEIEAPGGLQDLESAVRLYQSRIYALNAEIDKKGSRKAKNRLRRADIRSAEIKLGAVQSLVAIQDRRNA